MAQHPFLWGMLVALCVVAAAFFFRDYVLSRDRLFAFFGSAFVFLAINWAALELFPIASAESRHLAFVPRLIAFLLLIVAIIDKNRRG
jgi:threonine/homoserine efflux transporter RhtA